MAESRPNIVVILTDDQSRDSLSSMPNLRRFIADRGVTFTNTVIATPLCSPSRATLLTGRYAHEHGVLQNEGAKGGYRRFVNLGWDRDNLFTWLQDAGYHTGLIGKHLNGFAPGNPKPPGVDVGFITGTIGADGYAPGSWNVSVDGKRKQGSGNRTNELNRRAVAFIDEAPWDRPFFLWIGHKAPHSPLDPLPADLRAARGVRVPRTASFDEADISDKPGWAQRPALNARRVRALDAAWRRTIALLQPVDRGVADIVRALLRNGRLADTWIFYLSDNGYLFGQHRLTGKSMLYEPAVIFPILATGPGLPAGRTDERVVSTVDLAPTIRALAGLPPRADLPGQSLLGPAARTAALMETAGDRDRRIPALRGLRGRDWAWIASGAFEEYYHLAADPEQTQNAAAALTPERRAALRTRLAALARCRGRECAKLENASLPA